MWKQVLLREKIDNYDKWENIKSVEEITILSVMLCNNARITAIGCEE